MISFKALEESSGRYSQDSAFQDERLELLGQVAVFPVIHFRLIF